MNGVLPYSWIDENHVAKVTARVAPAHIAADGRRDGELESSLR